MSVLNALLPDLIRDGLAVLDAAGELVLWNGAARTITGWSAEAAARYRLAAIHEGPLELPSGKWVDVRRLEFDEAGTRRTAILFTDTSAQIELRETRSVLERVKLIDPITRLPARELALEHLRRAIALAMRDRRSVGVVALEGLATSSGDAATNAELLRQAARRVVMSVRASDLVARGGADGLTVVLSAMQAAEDVDVVAVRLLLALAQPFALPGITTARLAIRVGCATFPIDGNSPEGLFEAADARCERARRDGSGYEFRGAPEAGGVPRLAGA
jgi:diguanylate cyclase (GGDEF)-like protein